MKEFAIVLCIILIVFIFVEAILFDEIQRLNGIIEEYKRKNKWMHEQLEKRYSEGWADGYDERRNERW